jgi:hypothetical protein
MKSAEEVAERFWTKVNKTETCWLWTGAAVRGRPERKERYGQFWNGGKIERAHRYSYRLANGSIPEGLVIDHLCKETLCVNPDHLRAVTNRENILAGNGACARNLKKGYCPQGHKLGGDNVFPKQTDDRSCRTCHNANYMSRYYAKKVKDARAEALEEAAKILKCDANHEELPEDGVCFVCEMRKEIRALQEKL